MSNYKKVIGVIIGFVFLCVLYYAFSSVSNKSFPFSAPTFDTYVESIMKDWHVPGLALAVINGEKIAYIKAYGVLQHGSAERVNKDTIFAIGSCTKMFTAASLGILVDDDLLQWEDKARTYLPVLKLPTECMTQELNIIDMLSHRSGLEEVGMLWDHTTLSRQQLIEHMRFLKPIVGFREGWVYNNLMYLAAGEIVSAIAGVSWDEFLAQRIFLPLGMGRTNTTITTLADESNRATPHYVMDGEVHTIASHNIDSIAPAGGINSTIADMAKWLQLLVNSGEYNDASLIKKETVAQMSEPAAIVHKKYPYQLYGLGLGMFAYQGNEVIFHEGNIDGMSASLAIMPEKKIGIVILTNMHRGGVGKVLLNTIFDKYLGVQDVPDWNKKDLEHERKRIAEFTAEEEKKERSKLVDTIAPRPLSDYVGVYQNDLYGDMTITMKDGILMCTFLIYKGALIHWNGNIFTFDTSHINPLLSSPFYLAFDYQGDAVKKVHITYADIWMNDMDAEFIKK